jgi:hypothetical protein
MKTSRFVQCATVVAVAFSGAANATTTLSNEYSVNATATNVGVNTWQFDYSITNNNQGIGGYTGLDGLTIYIPDAATIVSTTSPAPLHGSPGVWSPSVGSTLDLGGNNSQNLTAPTGFKTLTWWGGYPESVYTPGSTASFSVILNNVKAGLNTIGISTYLASGTLNQQLASNQWGNYSTFTTNVAAAVAAVPEPETYAMLLAGLGLMGTVARRRKAKQA